MSKEFLKSSVKLILILNISENINLLMNLNPKEANGQACSLLYSFYHNEMCGHLSYFSSPVFLTCLPIHFSSVKDRLFSNSWEIEGKGEIPKQKNVIVLTISFNSVSECRKSPS